MFSRTLLRPLPVALALAYPSFASLLTTGPANGLTTVFPGGSVPTCTTFGGTPLTLSGFTVSAVFTQANGAGTICGAYSGLFGIAGNGTWNSLSMIFDNTGASFFEIDLGSDYSAAGGFMNYLPDASSVIVGTANPAIAAYSATQDLLEFYDLASAGPISTGANSFNEGAFRGIQRAKADIRYLRVGGSFLLMHDLTLAPAPDPTPEPGLAVPVLLALAALGLRRRGA